MRVQPFHPCTHVCVCGGGGGGVRGVRMYVCVCVCVDMWTCAITCANRSVPRTQALMQWT